MDSYEKVNAAIENVSPYLDANQDRNVPKTIEQRPWGRFECFTKNAPCTVKLIYLDGDKRLSLQYHKYRDEFWNVVTGPVQVQLEDKTKMLMTGDTILIPKRAVHRLVGAGVDVIVLEVSFGNFDEADIVRLQDDYRR